MLRVSKNQIIWGGNYFDLKPTRCFLIWDKVQRINQADCELAWTSFSSSARIFQYARGNESGFAPTYINANDGFKVNVDNCKFTYTQTLSIIEPLDYAPCGIKFTYVEETLNSGGSSGILTNGI